MAKNKRDFDISLDGLDAVLKKLKNMKGARARVALRQAMNTATTPILKTAKSLVPVRTRELKRSLGRKSKTYAKTNTVFVAIGPRAGFSGIKNGKKIDPLKYSHLVEFGHRIAIGGKLAREDRENTVQTGVDGGFVPAKPFLRPAWYRNQQQFVSTMRRKINEFIKKEATRGKR